MLANPTARTVAEPRVAPVTPRRYDHALDSAPEGGIPARSPGNRRPSWVSWLRQRFELSRGGQGQNIRPMEGVRGLAVFLVFLVHYGTGIVHWIGAGSALSAAAHDLRVVGRSGVDLFFVLSGYLIYGSLMARPQSMGRFMSRRVERIYPAFVVVFLVYLALSFILPAQSKIPKAPLDAAIYLAENLLLLPGLFAIEPMITVAWSLSYEMFFYVAIPLVIMLLRLRARSVTCRVGLFCGAALATAAYCAAFGGHVRLIMFASGILLYEATQHKLLRAPGSVAGAAGLLVGMLCVLLPVRGPAADALKVCIIFAAFFTACFTCVSRPDARLSRAFSWTPLRWLGNMSYSYYLLHGLALKAAFTALRVLFPPAERGGLFFCALLPLVFALTLVPTALLFLAVERPFSLTPDRRRRGAVASGERAAAILVGSAASQATGRST